MLFLFVSSPLLIASNSQGQRWKMSCPCQQSNLLIGWFQGFQGGQGFKNGCFHTAAVVTVVVAAVVVVEGTAEPFTKAAAYVMAADTLAA